MEHYEVCKIRNSFVVVDHNSFKIQQYNSLITLQIKILELTLTIAV